MSLRAALNHEKSGWVERRDCVANAVFVVFPPFSKGGRPHKRSDAELEEFKRGLNAQRGPERREGSGGILILRYHVNL